MDSRGLRYARNPKDSIEAIGSVFIIGGEYLFALAQAGGEIKIERRVHHRCDVVWIDVWVRATGHIGFVAARVIQSQKMSELVEKNRLKIWVRSSRYEEINIIHF